MNITKEVLEIDETLSNKIKNILMFLGIKEKLEKGNIIHIDNTNLAYIEPHKLIIDDITYLFFNECNEVFINTLEQSISFTELQNYIKSTILKGKN